MPAVKMCKINEILKRFPGVDCEENIAASALTSFCIGGEVRYLITLNDESSADKILKEIRSIGLEIVPIGAGTNILVSDNGFKGFFLRLGTNFKKIERLSTDTLKVGAATKINDLINYLKQNKMGGLAFLSGIPGTLGGAITMNAGAFGDEIKNHVLKVHSVTPDGESVFFDESQCQFEYRNSLFKGKDYFILSVELKVDPETCCDEEVEERMEYRAIRHTPGGRYAGSVFKNPSGDYAGKLLDDVGVKGLRIGTAYVSEKHANFIMADPGARAEDVIELMQVAALKVFYLTGIKLYPEIELIGFKLNWEDIFNIQDDE